MAKQWLDLSIDATAQVEDFPGAFFQAQESTRVPALVTLRIWETNRSGSVLFDNGATSDGEVFLKLTPHMNPITRETGPPVILSAPVFTPIDFTGIATLELNLLAPLIGNNFRALINAHCIYEFVDPDTP